MLLTGDLRQLGVRVDHFLRQLSQIGRTNVITPTTWSARTTDRWRLAHGPAPGF